MKKYANKILIAALIIFWGCIIVETPFMMDAYKAEKIKREENSKKWEKEWFEKMKKEKEKEIEHENENEE